MAYQYLKQDDRLPNDLQRLILSYCGPPPTYWRATAGVNDADQWCGLFGQEIHPDDDDYYFHEELCLRTIMALKFIIVPFV